MAARARLVLDALLLMALLIANAPGVTGVTVHEWMSLALVVPLLLHLLVNWEWVVRKTSVLFERLAVASPFDAAVDVCLFVSVVAVTLSGLVVSRSIAGLLGLSGSTALVWHATHAVSATAVIVLTLARLALHWRWITRVAFSRQRRRSHLTAPGALVPASTLTAASGTMTCPATGCTASSCHATRGGGQGGSRDRQEPRFF